MATYEVNEWCDSPDECSGSDRGDDFDTLEEARDAFERWSTRALYAVITLDGPDGEVARREVGSKRAAERQAAREDREWQREIAMEAGMAFGCDGYNDAMGW